MATYIAKPNGVSILYYSQQFNYKNGYSLEVSPRNQVTYTETEPGYI